MGNVTLDDRDGEILERLCRDEADVEALAEDVNADRAYLRERLPDLEDNGLVERTDEGYAVTDSGRRTLVASPAGTLDERIDTPPDVEERIQSFDLRTDREEAVRTAFTFLQYWGDAFGGEIADAVHSENPAGFETRGEWWSWVRDRLAELPTVEPPTAAENRWRYGGTPAVEDDPQDGRVVLEGEPRERSSARYALERADLDPDERRAARAAFDHLVREGGASAAEIESRVYPDHDAGRETSEEWWRAIRPVLESLPGVERSEDGEAVWEYHQDEEGPMSTGPGADLPDEPLGPDEE